MIVKLIDKEGKEGQYAKVEDLWGYFLLKTGRAKETEKYCHVGNLIFGQVGHLRVDDNGKMYVDKDMDRSFGLFKYIPAKKEAVRENDFTYPVYERMTTRKYYKSARSSGAEIEDEVIDSMEAKRVLRAFPEVIKARGWKADTLLDSAELLELEYELIEKYASSVNDTMTR